MDPPATVLEALADREVENRRVLEAGAGVGNGTAGLLDAGARSVFAITNERDHARTVRDRPDPAGRVRTAVLEADLRAIPLPDDTVDLVFAHALLGVVEPAALPGIVSELTRVATPSASLVVDEYEPIPRRAPLRRLFAVENAAAELATGRPALSFYPAALVRRIFAGYGWEVERERTLLDPVPWDERLLAEHLDVIRGFRPDLPAPIGGALVEEAARLVDEIGAIETGEMYSVAFRRRSANL